MGHFKNNEKELRVLSHGKRLFRTNTEKQRPKDAEGTSQNTEQTPWTKPRHGLCLASSTLLMHY